MANASITLSGIHQAVDNLNYRPGTVKYKATQALQSFYTSQERLNGLTAIDADTLIQQIWDTGGDPAKIRSKRRNFSSLRSSINSDLNKLAKKEMNPENIIITETNIFDMTEEAKTSLLHSFTDAVQTGDIDLAKATDILKAVTDFLKEIDITASQDESQDIIKEIKKVLARLGGSILDEAAEDDGAAGTGEEEDDVETVKIDDDQDIEEVELDEDEELEEIYIDDNEEIEEVLLDDDEEIEEIEEIELDEDEELEDIEEVELDEDEDIEEIELDEDDKLDEIEELDEEELAALEEFRKARELAEHFDDTLGDREKKFNAYIKIPEGIYTIGTRKSLKSSLELQQFEMPLVYMGKFPVTNALFEIFIEQTGYMTTAEKKGYGVVYHARFEKKGNRASWRKQAGFRDMKGACWYQPGGPGTSLHDKRNHPVVQVSVEDAFAYASWIGRRIPTEAEWEAAARTDLGLKYPWGINFDPQALNIEQTGFSDTCAVDTFETHANEFGMADMLGNVMEWTADQQPPPISTKTKQKYNVAKGGAWNATDAVTISSRGLFKQDFTANTIGFRCISELFQ